MYTVIYRFIFKIIIKKVMKLLIKLMSTLGLCLALMVPASAQQSRTVNGTVIGPDNSPLANATVVVKGIKQAVKTDLSGKFTISLPVGPQTLVISYDGDENNRIFCFD